MTSEEVMEIVANNLGSNSSEEALVLSQRDIAIFIINKLAGQSLDESFLEILSINAEIHSELSFFSSYDFQNSTAVDLPIERLKMLLSMYAKFIEVFIFFYQHYENLDFGEFSKAVSREQLKKLIDLLEIRYGEYMAQFHADGAILLYSNDIATIKYGIDFAQQVLLGKERFIQFMKEFNSANSMLKQTQTVLLPQDEEGLEEN